MESTYYGITVRAYHNKTSEVVCQSTVQTKRNGKILKLVVIHVYNAHTQSHTPSHTVIPLSPGHNHTHNSTNTRS